MKAGEELAARLAELPPAPYVDELGLEFTGLGSGWAESELEVSARHTQAQGLVHAGVLATMADHTAGACASTVAPEGHVVVTVEFKVNLLRPAAGPRLRCRAETVKPGRSVTFAEARIRSDDDRLCATASVTLAVVAAPTDG